MTHVNPHTNAWALAALFTLLLWGCSAQPLRVADVRRDLDDQVATNRRWYAYFPQGTFQCDVPCHACEQRLLRDDLLFAAGWLVTQCQEGAPLTISLTPRAAQALNGQPYALIADAVVEHVEVTEQDLDAMSMGKNQPRAQLLVTYRFRPTPIGALIKADLRCADPQPPTECERFNAPQTAKFTATQYRFGSWTVHPERSGRGNGGGGEFPPF